MVAFSLNACQTNYIIDQSKMLIRIAFPDWSVADWCITRVKCAIDNCISSSLESLNSDITYSGAL